MTDGSVDHDQLIRCAQELIRIRTVLGGESRLAAWLCEQMRELGFDSAEIDPAGNAVGIWQGRENGPTLLMDAHTDTVDVIPEEAWTRPPFGGELVDGRLYGRGSSDMKGALAAMLFATSALPRERLRGKVVVSASVGEESLEGAALKVVMDDHPPDFVIIGEASQLDVMRAGRGRAEWVIETEGSPAHASTPDQGSNAVHKMRRVIEEIERLPLPNHSFMGRGVLCLTDIISVPYPAHSVVPSGCRVTYERRLLAGESEADLTRQLGEACQRAGAPETRIALARARYESDSGWKWDEPKWFPPWEFSENHPLVERALLALNRTGQQPGLRSYQFCTNAAYSAGRAGVPTIGYGPSSESLAHIVDEYIEVDQLIAACQGYHALALELLR